jgi:hypothetical protein
MENECLFAQIIDKVKALDALLKDNKWERENYLELSTDLDGYRISVTIGSIDHDDE